MFVHVFVVRCGWHGLEFQVTGTGSQDKRRGFTNGSKVRAKVHANAGRALRVVWRGTQVPQPVLLQAA